MKAQLSVRQVHLPYSFTKEYYIEPVGVKKTPAYAFIKRCFDIVVSATGLLLLFVPMCLIAFLIKCSSKGPVIFAQERLGKDGKAFRIFKFRTMVEDAEKNGAQWCDEKDPRVTPLGAILRKTHLDELPQLWNILAGDMSFVGPRPERACYYTAFEEYIHGFSERLRVKPGLTGLAQISGGSRMPPEEKIQWDVEYIKSRSFALDLKIMLKTAMRIVNQD